MNLPGEFLRQSLSSSMYATKVPKDVGSNENAFSFKRPLCSTVATRIRIERYKETTTETKMSAQKFSHRRPPDSSRRNSTPVSREHSNHHSTCSVLELVGYERLSDPRRRGELRPELRESCGFMWSIECVSSSDSKFQLT